MRVEFVRQNIIEKNEEKKTDVWVNIIGQKISMVMKKYR